MKKVVIVGNGKLADLFEENFNNYSDLPLVKFSNGIKVDKETVFLHIGSGREYEDTLKLATKNGSLYIQAATEKDYKMDPPNTESIRFITAPNLDLNIIKLFYLFKSSGALFKGEDISIIESHQSSKESLAGTAIKFCDYLNINRNDLVSIRDPENQKSLNIKNINHHAYHKIQIGDEDSKITIETKMEGALSYVKGAAKIVKAAQKLKKGNYQIDDLIELKLL